MKIWYQSTLDFAHHANYQRALTAHFRKVSSLGTEVLLNGRNPDPTSQLSAAEIISSPILYHSIVVPAFVQAVFAAESADADVFVTASFSEPILPELRALAKIPVISMSEACFVAAAASAPKIGLVTLNKHIIHFLEKSIALHKWKDRISGIHLIEGEISETELDTKYSQPSPYLAKLSEGMRRAIAAGAEVIIPAEGVLAMMAAENGMHEIDGVPVIDAVGSTILFAEYTFALEQRTKVAQSRVAYPLPSEAGRKLIASR
jgi:allantoin racemase